MTANEIETILSSQYIDEARSKFLKIRLKNLSVYAGEFIKQNQRYLNVARNKWILSTADGHDLIDGKEIKKIYLFNRR